MTALAYCTVVGKFTRLDTGSPPVSTPLTGQITFTASPTGGKVLLATETPPRSIVIDPLVVALDGTGAFTTQVVATDQTSVTNPSGFTYTATFQFQGVTIAPFSFSAPAGSTVDLTLVSPAPASNGVYTDLSSLYASLADPGVTRANLKTSSSHSPRRIERPNSTRRTVSTAVTTVALNAATAVTTGRVWAPTNTPVLGTYNTLNPNAPFDYGWGGAWTWDNTFGGPGNATYGLYTLGKYLGTNSSIIRFETDATLLTIILYPTGALGFQIYVDDQPVVADATVDSNFYQNLTFPDHTTKVIEIRTSTPFFGIYTDAQSTVWLPKKITGPKVLLVGDSHAAGTGGTSNERGMFQTLADEMGLEQVIVDGVAATGFASGGAGYSGSFVSRMPGHISLAPDMLIVDGGGQDDLAGGVTSTATIAAMVTYFSGVRAALPKCKLVLMEPMNVPGFQALAASVPYTTHIANYKTALAPYAVHHIDCFTNPNGPWITGAGYAGHLTGVGNGDIYVVADTYHFGDLGYKYLRRRLAPRALEILEGAL